MNSKTDIITALSAHLRNAGVDTRKILYECGFCECCQESLYKCYCREDPANEFDLGRDASPDYKDIEVTDMFFANLVSSFSWRGQIAFQMTVFYLCKRFNVYLGNDCLALPIHPKIDRFRTFVSRALNGIESFNDEDGIDEEIRFIERAANNALLDIPVEFVTEQIAEKCEPEFFTPF